MEILQNKDGSMQYMKQVVPPGTSSSSINKKHKPSRKGTLQGRRSLTPKKKQQQQQKTNWVKGQKSKQSLNSSWYSKSSRRSYDSRSSKSSYGTKYSSLSNNNQKNNNNKQYPQICRYWKKSKCSKEGCEFAHYEFKHLNTTYNEILKEGAKHINQCYQQNIEQGKVLTQITYLQYLTIEQIEEKMKKTDCYKEEIQIAVVNKSAFKRFKKEYREQLKVLNDDSYNNKIQQKIDVFKQQINQITKFDKKKNQQNTQSNQSTQQQLTQNLSVAHQSNNKESEEKIRMDIEKENQKQQEKPQITKTKDISPDGTQNKQKGRQANRVKSIEKKKNNNNNSIKPILKNSTEIQMQEKQKNSQINQKRNNKNMKLHTFTLQNPMILNQSHQPNKISNEELQRSETLVNKVSYISMNYLSELAIQTARNQGNFPKEAVQRLFPTIMTTSSLYDGYILAYIDMNPENIQIIANSLKATNQTTQQIQAVVLFDSVMMYIFKLSEINITKGLNKEEKNQKVEAYINNIASLIIGKIKIILNQSNLGIEETTTIAMSQILMEQFSDSDYSLYRKNYIINIGSEEKPILIAVEIANTHMLQQEKRNKSKRKSSSEE